MNTTILYYSSGHEDPAFEQRVVESLLAVSGDLPIISITQQPLDLGQNICVGDVGASGFNMFRQVLIGLMAADTQFVASAESDSIYPPGYFSFVPPRDDVAYRATKMYVMPDRRDYFFHKVEGSTVGQIIGRDYYLATLKKLFDGAPQWCVEEKNFPKERHRQSDIFSSFERWEPEYPFISFKTHRGMRYYTHSEREPILELPYWGSGKAVRDYYYKGIRYAAVPA